MSTAPPVVVRVMTYNVRSLRNDARTVAELIRAAEPDVVCIQEAPRFLRWRSKCAELARRTGLVVVTGGRAAAGNLILSSLAVDVLGSEDVLLSKVPKMHRRGMALAHLRLSGRRFAVVGAHLDLAETPRLRHIGEIAQVVDARVPHDVPTLICGDINDDPDSATWRAVCADRQDAFAVAAATGAGRTAGDDASSAEHADPVGATSGPQDVPRRRIDAIFVPTSVRVRDATVLGGARADRASDHRPLVVTLELA